MEKTMLLIGDVIIVDSRITLPIEIIPHHIFRRANEEEISNLKRRLGDNYTQFVQIHYEHELFDGKFVKLIEEEYRYSVIDFSGESTRADHDLVLAMLLADSDLNVLIEIISGTGALQLQYKVHNFIQDNILVLKPKKITHEDFEEIRWLYYLINEFRKSNAEGKYSEINKALEDLYRLNVVPKSSPFYIVSMMSIIESLVTHNPGDNGPTITHQLKNKLLLLNNRFCTSISQEFEFEIAFDKLIAKLYKYRSNIAHGSDANFTGELQVLKNKEYATELIYSLLKKIIIQALQEPQLINDLRNC